MLSIFWVGSDSHSAAITVSGLSGAVAGTAAHVIDSVPRARVTWVEKKIRHHLARACQRRGFGWKRWNKDWLYRALGLFSEYRACWGQSLRSDGSHKPWCEVCRSA